MVVTSIIVTTIIVFILVDILLRMFLTRMRAAQTRKEREQALDVGLKLDVSEEAPTLTRVELDSPTGQLFGWSGDSTYIRKPPYFEGMSREAAEVSAIQGARALALLGDSVTTDHISPAGAIKADTPAGQYLLSLGVKPADFNSLGSRRGWPRPRRPGRRGGRGCR